MRLVISNRILDDINMDEYTPYVYWCPGIHAYIFSQKSGIEHYRLCSYISQHLPKNSRVVDIGTFYGASALAFAMNKDIHITTYDIEDHITKDNVNNSKTIHNIENIQYKLKNFMENPEELNVIASANVIFLDVNPHDGIKEIEMLNKIRESGFKGLLFLDDIHLNKEMENFWNSIPEKKQDITKYGHWSGTGIVYFSNEDELIFI